VTETPESEPEPERFDAPNQQVVRGDESGPADEGTGGSPPVEPGEEGERLEPSEPEPEPEAGRESKR
jgi:hypothetical protein